MLTIDRYCARAALERQLLRSTPRTIRATIEGLPYIRVLREGHPRLVPIIEIPDDEIASMLPAATDPRAVAQGGSAGCR